MKYLECGRKVWRGVGGVYVQGTLTQGDHSTDNGESLRVKLCACVSIFVLAPDDVLSICTCMSSATMAAHMLLVPHK